MTFCGWKKSRWRQQNCSCRSATGQVEQARNPGVQRQTRLWIVLPQRCWGSWGRGTNCSSFHCTGQTCSLKRNNNNNNKSYRSCQKYYDQWKKLWSLWISLSEEFLQDQSKPRQHRGYLLFSKGSIIKESETIVATSLRSLIFRETIHFWVTTVKLKNLALQKISMEPQSLGNYRAFSFQVFLCHFVFLRVVLLNGKNWRAFSSLYCMVKLWKLSIFIQHRSFSDSLLPTLQASANPGYELKTWSVQCIYTLYLKDFSSLMSPLKFWVFSLLANKLTRFSHCYIFWNPLTQIS